MKKILPPIAVIFAAVLWSLDGLIRQELYAVSSFFVVALEHTFGALLFSPFLIKSWPSIKSLKQRQWVSILWISIFGGILGTFFYTKALSYINYIDLSVVVLLQKLQPVFAIALATVILKEKLSTRFIKLAALALVGGYFVTFGTTPISNWNDKTIIAALLSILAAFAWGSSTVLGKHALKNLPFSTVTSLRLSLTSILTIILLFFTEGDFYIQHLTATQWRNLIFIVFSTGAVALFIYYFGLNHLPASHATLYELAWPLSAVILDWRLNGNSLSPVQILGAILLIGSMVSLSREKKSIA